MSSKIIHIDALDPSGKSSPSFVAQNLRGDRIVIQAHHNAPTEHDPASSGLGPMEALLAALGACSAVDVQDIMRKKRTPLLRYRIELDGARSDSTPARYTKITMRHLASGEGVGLESLERAVRMSVEKYCSVAASLNPDIEMVIEVALL